MRKVSVFLMVLLLTACGLARITREGPEPEIILGGAGPLSQIPGADLTIGMSPGGSGQSTSSMANSSMDGTVAGSYEEIASFATGAGGGHLARFTAVMDGVEQLCIEIVLPYSGSAACGPDTIRFNVLHGDSQHDQGPRIRSIGIFGPSEVIAYEVDLDGYVIAIQAANGAGYANWTGDGQPIAITAHLANGSTEEVPLFGSG